MASKRVRGDVEADSGSGPQPGPKKARKGFRVGPENLPDGPWRRKLDKVKKNLIVQAKTKKQYAKIKARYEQEQAARKSAAGAPAINTHSADNSSKDDPEEGAVAEDTDAQIHPERQALLDGENEDSTVPVTSLPQDHDQDSNPNPYPHRRRDERQRKGQRQKRPGYFDKSLEQAAQKQAAAEARAKEIAERRAERERRLAERERYRKAMAKARAPGPDGKRRLGRESQVLLEKVKRIVGDKR